jgi:hypothetical protein
MGRRKDNSPVKKLSIQFRRIRTSIGTESSPKISVFLMTETHGRTYTTINGNGEEDEGA